ncbi:MAG: ABC transporter substrate-binding protein [Oscillospiraceae bacterium]|nr:ABC transporter substrate-binding protein [Oscillospiraceae bacterium]
MIKKKSALVLCFILAFALLVGCGKTNVSTSTDVPKETASAQPVEQVKVSVAGLSGPTSMGMIKMISEDALNSDAYAVDYEIASAPDTLTAKLITGEVQIAALPTNSAAVLYNKTQGQVQFLAQNTLGVLYLVGKDSAGVTSLSDLAGKTVTLSGSGGVPQYAVEYILDKAGIKDKVTLSYLTDHASVAQALLGGDADLAILPQPFVTQALAKNPDMKILLDLNKEWDAASGGASVLSMGCLVIRKDFADANPEFVTEFLEQYEASVNFVNENPADAAKLIAEVGIMPSAELAEKAIPYCNIVYKPAQDAKTEINGFLQVLYDFNPASVGGTMPDGGFYFAAKG